ncbi:MAG: PorT family protein [Fibromonadales bacterium]|nr:PorT family protein [Fibromonadales bacterium]
MNYFNKFIFASLFVVVAVFAQDGNTHFGVHVGLGMAGLNHPAEEEEDTDGDGKFVVAIGGVYSMKLSEAVNFDPEALFSYAGMPGQKSTEIRLDIPVIFKFYPLDYFFLQVGPQISLSLYYADDISGKKFKYRNILDVGPVVGIGYQIDGNSTVDVRYYYGMTKYFDGKVALEQKAQSFQLFAGYNYLF